MEEATSAGPNSNVAAPLSSIKSGISTFMSGVSEMAHGVVQELGEIRMVNGSPSPSSMPITAAQLEEKLNSAEEQRFKEWMASFNLEERQNDISQLLANNSSVQALYQQLVPNELNVEEFWGRYFFKLDQEMKKEEYRAALLSKTKAMASKLSESEFSWDDEDQEVQEAQPSEEDDKKDEPPKSISPALEAPSIASNPENNEIDKSVDAQTSPAQTPAPEVEKIESSATLPSAPTAPSAQEEPAQQPSSITPASQQEEHEDVFEWN